MLLTIGFFKIKKSHEYSVIDICSTGFMLINNHAKIRKENLPVSVEFLNQISNSRYKRTPLWSEKIFLNGEGCLIETASIDNEKRYFEITLTNSSLVDYVLGKQQILATIDEKFNNSISMNL